MIEGAPDGRGIAPRLPTVVEAVASLNLLSLCALVLRVDGVIAAASRGWENFTGYPASEVVGRELSDFIEPAHAAFVLAALQGAEQLERPRMDEVRLRMRDRSERWVLLSSTPVGESGLVSSYCVTVADIDERRRADDALRESEAMYRALHDALPGVTWAALPNGELTHVFDRWLNTDETVRNQSLGDGWIEAVHPDDRARVRAVWNRSLETGEPYKIEYRIRLPDGTYHWLLVRALPERAANGSIVRWVGVIIDIEDRYASEEARETYAALVENSSDFIAILDPRGNVVYVNRAGRDLLGIGSLDEARTTPWPEYFAESDRRFVIEEIGPSVERAGSWSGDFHLRHFRSEKAVPIALNVFALRSRDGAPLGIATVSRDLGERKRVEDGLRLLSRTGAAVVDSLDYARTLRNIARAFVDGFAAYCLIDVIRPDGTWERTVEHRDPSLVKLFLDLEQPRGNHPIARTIESGISSITPIDDDWALNLDSVTDRLAAIRRLRVRSIITVPIKLPSGELVGAITCALDDATIRDNFGADDLAFVEEVGRRAGSAIANVRLYERERRVALELQAASLPATLPAIEGVLLDAAYRPGSDEAKIGGDWYDAFELADKRLVFTVGDVLGHGLQAAVTMAKLRLAMQSAAIIDADPNVMLSVADAILRVSDPDAYATAIAAVYDREQRMVTFAGAGHPAPALRTPDGRLDFMSNMGVMLGLGGQRDRQTLSVAVPSGSVLIFYTDGLVEVTRDIDEGYGRMSRALASDQIQTAERPAELLVDAVLMNDSARDDIAVLVVRFL